MYGFRCTGETLMCGVHTAEAKLAVIFNIAYSMIDLIGHLRLHIVPQCIVLIPLGRDVREDACQGCHAPQVTAALPPPEDSSNACEARRWAVQTDCEKATMPCLYHVRQMTP